MNNSDLQKEINRIKNLKNNDFSESEIILQAKNNLRFREFKATPIFSDPTEQKVAEEKFKNYLQNNIIESENDIDILSSLVFNEVYELRIQKQINDSTVADPDNPDKKIIFSDKLTNQLTTIQNQKLDLKKKLGIGAEQKAKDELSGLQMLRKRFEDHINANKNEFTIVAPDGTLLLLRRRVKDFDCMRHPYFEAGRWLFNYNIFKDVKDGKLSKTDAWRYLTCASQGVEYKPAFSEKYCTDYIDYILDRWAEVMSHFENK